MPERLLRLNVTRNPRWQADLDAFLGHATEGSTSDDVHLKSATADPDRWQMGDRLAQVEAVLVQKAIAPGEWSTETYIGFDQGCSS
jgi:hypothetical protein